MKKFLLILGIILSAGLLVSCKPKEKNPDNPDPNIPAEKELTKSIKVSNLDLIALGDSKQIIVTKDENTEDEIFHFEVENEEVLSVTQDGIIKALSLGETKLTVKIKDRPAITDSITIKVVNQAMLKADAKTGDKILLDDIEYVFGVTLFSTLEEIEEVFNSEAIIHVLSGSYSVNSSFNGDFSIFSNEDVTFEGTLEFKGGSVSLEGIKFINDSKLIFNDVDSINFSNNIADNINQDFILVNNALDLNIVENKFTNINSTVITIKEFKNETVTNINKNQFNDVGEAINISNIVKLSAKSSILLYRNKIDKVNNALVIDLGPLNNKGSHTAYARFNEVTNYEKAVILNTGSKFELTFNYWGVKNLDLNKFENVNETLLLKNYENAKDILSEKNYNPKVPIFVEILNPIELIELGQNHRYEVRTLPYSASDSVRWITSKPNYISITTTSYLTPLKSGTIVLTAQASGDRTKNDKTTLEIMTNPGIQLETSNIKHDLEINDEFTVKATPFPYTYENKAVRFESSNELIATVDQNGLVKVIGEGEFTIKASLVEEDAYFEEIKFESYGSLDEANILDFITKRQLSFSKLNEFIVYGAGFNYDAKHHDSVSRLLIEDIEINTSKLLPVSPGIRPGSKKNSNIKEEYKFNDENIVWIVVHETANTAAGAGALSHANYLSSNADKGVVLNTSWHMTVDSELVYQHLPYDEVGYHAGDGQILPGESSTYFGGGNRNGIGIEMSVNEDGNIMKTWQKTAKISAELMTKYNMPFSQLAYHNDFSGKECPQSMRRGGFIPLFEEFAKNEFDLLQNFNNVLDIKLISNDPEYLDNAGIIIKNPTHSMTVSYTIEVTTTSGTLSRDFTTFLPGSWK
ncbi:N-acetylmuramoyl-L-alanine amidase [Haploplasma modicum]|uniref:N-acetylmuramoyl-L-alanine amidase n=1 Tax=Haploplasma modicum TaxID=2150 RepID=UPI00047880CE|nr:N-acetylmuramoyl-L-alanine amidase [Haploplasma modicum]